VATIKIIFKNENYNKNNIKKKEKVKQILLKILK